MEIVKVLSHKLFFDDWIIWTLDLLLLWIKLWTYYSKMFTNIDDWRFDNSNNSKLNLFVQGTMDEHFYWWNNYYQLFKSSFNSIKEGWRIKTIPFFLMGNKLGSGHRQFD
jgi:hypothetical protein